MEESDARDIQVPRGCELSSGHFRIVYFKKIIPRMHLLPMYLFKWAYHPLLSMISPFGHAYLYAVQVLMEHSGELVLNRARNAKLVQSPSMAHDITWFSKTLMSLCKALVYAGLVGSCWV